MPVGGQPLGGADRAAVVGSIDRWARAQLDVNPVVVAVEHDPERPLWLIRTTGEEREYTTVWFTVRQRTLHVETQFMPAPETDVAACYEYLLRRNATLAPLRFAIGDEDAVYLVGEIPLERVDDDELDLHLGAAYAACEELFPTAMSLGFAGRYRRRSR